MPPSRPLRVGALAATLTFFEKDTETLDIGSIQRHAVRLAAAGLVGLVVLGSNGEAPHLSRQERSTVIRETRRALDEADFHDLPLIVGASAASVHETVDLHREAQEAGGDYALTLPPSYYRGAMSTSTIADYFRRVADLSPLPILLYSFPAVCAGIDMDSDLLISISQHKNIVGTKFTCGDTGKLARVARSMKAANFRAPDAPYVCYGGLADFALMALVAGGSGFIAGGGNVFPKACTAIVELFESGKFNEAIEMQKVLSDGDWYHTKAGVAGTKALLPYGGVPRLPLQSHPEDDIKALQSRMGEITLLEKSL